MDTCSERLGKGIMGNSCSSGTLCCQVFFHSSFSLWAAAEQTAVVFGKIFVSLLMSSPDKFPPEAKSYHLVSFEVSSQSVISLVWPSFLGSQEVVEMHCFNMCKEQYGKAQSSRQYRCKRVTERHCCFHSHQRILSLWFHAGGQVFFFPGMRSGSVGCSGLLACQLQRQDKNRSSWKRPRHVTKYRNAVSFPASWALGKVTQTQLSPDRFPVVQPPALSHDFSPDTNHSCPMAALNLEGPFPRSCCTIALLKGKWGLQSRPHRKEGFCLFPCWAGYQDHPPKHKAQAGPAQGPYVRNRKVSPTNSPWKLLWFAF